MHIWIHTYTALCLFAIVSTISLQYITLFPEQRLAVGVPSVVLISPGLWPKGVRDPLLRCCFLIPIAMTIRVLPGAFCLEPCPLNRCQTTHEFITSDGLKLALPSVAVDTEQHVCSCVMPCERFRCTSAEREQFVHFNKMTLDPSSSQILPR